MEISGFKEKWVMRFFIVILRLLLNIFYIKFLKFCGFLKSYKKKSTLIFEISQISNFINNFPPFDQFFVKITSGKKCKNYQKAKQ